MRSAANTEADLRKPLRVLIAGGGTGGHVVPALAIARELRDFHGAEVELLGTASGIETKLVPAEGFPLRLIRVGQLANVSLATRLKTLASLPWAVARAARLLRAFKPQVVVGVGGYASGPAMVAALLLRIPTMVYEPNAAPGLVNRKVGRYVTAAAIAFEEVSPLFRGAVVTGVPVRKEIFATGPLANRPRLLITAGSNGARIFNEYMPLIAARLLAVVPGLTILHQTGDRVVHATEAAYRERGIPPDQVEVRAFVHDMPQQLQLATLVLARSGSTVAELAAAGRPSLLVPFPQSADNHQTQNALAMVRVGAADMAAQADLTPDLLFQKLSGLLSSPDRLSAMANSARSAAKPDALQRIAGIAAALACDPSRKRTC